jgi:hypothetical protein
MSPKTKELLFSTLLTFITGLLFVITPEIMNLTLDSFTDGTVVGLIVAGIRLGVKLAAESILAKYAK